MELTILTKKITLVSIYRPNEDKPNFYKNLKQKIQDFRNENVTICGDWNLVLNPDVDTENYLHINNPRARTEVLNLLRKIILLMYKGIYMMKKDSHGGN